MRFPRIHLCRALAVPALFWSGLALAAPQAPTDPVARDELKQGYELAQANKCPEAIPHLQESLKRDPRAITLINLADCEEKTGKLADAIVHWGDARASAHASGEKGIEDEATARAAALDTKLPRLTLSLSKNAPADATVERDGVVLGAPSFGVALPVDPGEHVIIVHAAGHDDLKKTVTVVEGDKQTLDLTVGPIAAPQVTTAANAPPPDTSKRKLSPLVPIGFGVGAAGIIVGAITGAMTLSKGSDADEHCSQTAGSKRLCDSPSALNDATSGKTLGAVSTVAFIVGGAGVAVGIVGLLSGRSSGKKTSEEPAQSAKVDVGFGPTNVFLRGRF